jgi:hypothetical protein
MFQEKPKSLDLEIVPFHAKRASSHADIRAEAILYWTYNTSKKVLSRPEMQGKWTLSISRPGKYYRVVLFGRPADK